MFKYILPAMLVIAFASCRPQTFTPKPVGYFRIDTPSRHEYRLFDEPGFPYTFEYPVYSKIERDTAFFAEKADNPYWLNINFTTLYGIINITYKNISSKESFAKMVEESYRFSEFHTKKADYIDQANFHTANNVYGIVYTVGGNAASRYQFTATDSVKHFVRGALYFDVSPNADSLKPATDFIEQDIRHFIATLRFR